MRILLTGSTGFIGQHLTRKLITQHHIGLILRPNAKQEQVAKLPQQAQRIIWDGSATTLPALMNQFKPQLVIHLASLFLGTHQTPDIDGLIDSNIRFPTLVLETALAAGCKRFLHTGSAWQHYNNASFAPVNLYASTKQSFADILTYYVEVQGLSALTLELTDTYGVDDPRAKLIPILRKTANEGGTLSLSPGDQWLDFVHVDDVIDGYGVAIEQLLALPAAQQKIYALRSGEPITLKNFITLFNQISPHPVKAEWGARDYRPRETMVPWSSGVTLPNWQPKITLRVGLKQLIENC